MQSRRVFLALLILAASLIGACVNAGGAGSTPTRSGEAVIETAEALAELTRAATLQTLPLTPEPPTATSTPVTPTFSPTATQGAPYVVANYNANVRDGPDESFTFVDVMLESQRGEVLGRYENQDYNPTTWWYIRRIDQGKDGWVWSGAVTLYGDEIGIPLIDAALTPTPDSG